MNPRLWLKWLSPRLMGNYDDSQRSLGYMNKSHKSRDGVSVCLASLSFYPLYSGPAVRFQRYAPGLADRGVRMRVFTQAVTTANSQRRGLVSNQGEPNSDLSSILPDGLPVQRTQLPGDWRRRPLFFRQLARYCEGQQDEVEVVQFLSLHKWAIPWLYRLRHSGIATVYTHTLLGEFSSNQWKLTLQRFDRRLPLNLVDCVVVSSSVMAGQLSDIGVSSRIEVIPNGVDVQRFRPVQGDAERLSLRRKLGLDPGWDVILAIGPIIARKGVDTLVDAFGRLCREHPNVRLVLVGPRHDMNRNDNAPFHRYLQNTIAGANAEDRVIFTGPVSNVEDYLRAADLFVFPSRREGMPNVVPEAMACALPVVSTPFIGLPAEFGDPGTHYVLSSWDPVELAGDVGRLLVNADKRYILGRNARYWVEQNLDVNQSLDRYTALYGELADRSHLKK